MERTLKRLMPGIIAAAGALIVAGIALAVTRALDFDMDFELDWDDLPA